MKPTAALLLTLALGTHLAHAVITDPAQLVSAYLQTTPTTVRAFLAANKMAAARPVIDAASPTVYRRIILHARVKTAS